MLYFSIRRGGRPASRSPRPESAPIWRKVLRNDTLGSPAILIVSGRDAARARWEKAITAEGWRGLPAGTVGAALRILQTETVEAVVADEGCRAGAVCDTLRALGRAQPDSPVILIGAAGASEDRVEALREGAFQVLCEPAAECELVFSIGQALEHRELVRQHRHLRQQAMWDSQQTGLVGCSPAIREARKCIAACAEGRSPVLIEGEPGTGKELVARIIYSAGPRQELPFVPVRCHAPSEVLEAELFGHAPSGQFPFAGPMRGALADAFGGTLYLEDVGELGAVQQVKLLRALREGEVRISPRGQAFPVNVRLIASSSCRISGLVRLGRFHEELFELIHIIEINLPPLRHRPEDLGALAEHFLSMHAARTGQRWSLSSASLLMLQTHDWPGNVDDLKAALSSAVRQSPDDTLRPEHFPPEVQASSRRDSRPEDLYAGLPKLEDLARRYMSYVIRFTGGNKAEAAAILGISRKRYYRMVNGSRPSRRGRKNPATTRPRSGIIEGTV